MIIFYNLAPVAQLDRALGYGPGGSGFDSYQAHQNYENLFTIKCCIFFYYSVNSFNFVNNIFIKNGKQF